MSTPAYDPQDPAGLDGGDEGTSVPIEAQAQLNTLADEAAINGMLGWNETTTHVGAVITKEIALRGAYGVRIDYTYVPSGPAAGLVATETHYWSNDTGATWTLRTDTPNGVNTGTLTYTYDGAGLCTAATWS